MYVYVCMYVCVYVCVCMYVCMCVCVYMCVCMCVCMYVCMYVCGDDRTSSSKTRGKIQQPVWHDIPRDRKLLTTAKVSNLKSHQPAEFLLTYHEIQPVQKKGPGNT